MALHGVGQRHAQRHAGSEIRRV